MAEFRINISRLSDGIHEYHLSAEPSKIGLDERFRGLLTVDARLDKSLKQILVQTSIKAEITYTCDRCLDEFTSQLEPRYSLVYIQGDRSMVDVKKDEEIQVLSPDTNYIDLDEDIRQYIELAVPQKLLCKEECLGICPICGVNKNNESCACSEQTHDTRWEALKKLSSN